MNLVQSTSTFHYVRVSLVIWRTDGLSRIRNVGLASGLCLKTVLESKLGDDLPIVVDLKRVVSVIDRNLSDFFELVFSSGKEVHFINGSQIKADIRSLYDELADPNVNSLSNNEGNMVVHRGEITLQKSSTEIVLEINESIDTEIKKLVSASFVPNKNSDVVYLPLSSTPILATGQYDASLIISDPDSFSIVCLRMADIVESMVQTENILGAQLLSVSLRSSPFANAISLLLDMPMRTIDHLGPSQKVYDFQSFYQFGLPNTNYIFIGDFIVCGTEMKLARLFSKYSSSELKHAVAIGTVLDRTRYSGYSVDALVNLKDLNPLGKYKLFEE